VEADTRSSGPLPEPIHFLMSSEQWQIEPGRVLMARLAGLMFLAGAILTALGMALPHPPEAFMVGFGAIAVLCVVAALVLFRLGVDLAQGMHLGKPMPVADVLPGPLQPSSERRVFSKSG
jgi:hypothetical protein